MARIIFTFGILTGTVIIGSAILGIVLTSGESIHFLEWLGYLVMLVALSMIFVGIKRYRDQYLGGVITFVTATLVGLGIAVVASVIYVAVWEVYLAMTDHAFIVDYAQGIIAAKEADGVSSNDMQVLVAEMAQMREQYANPLYRLPMTFVEIFPIGLLVTLLSAAVLRNSKVLPAN